MSFEKFLLLSLLFFNACGSDDLPQISKVDNLRVLAMKSNPVAVLAGNNSATVSALIADPKGSGRSITYEWKACNSDAVDSSGTQCTSSIATNTSTTTSTAPTFSFNNGLSGSGSVFVTLKATAGSETRLANKYVYVVTQAAQQVYPPSVSALVIDGSYSSTSFTAKAGQSYTVKLVVSGTVSSNSFSTWGSDSGSFSASRVLEGLENTFIAPNVSGTYTIYAVFNDGSGGVDFKTRTVVVP